MSKVEKNSDNLKGCLCANCPTYNDCAREKKEILFCSQANGKGTCAYKMQGCICPVCVVYKKNGLDASFYCIYGSADEIENKKP
ncbi:MAG: DUF2769 domain-containing protein [Candidatus Paceibacterota bacterium]|jgi:hypothetical protein